MKYNRIISMLLAVVMVFGLCACGKDKASDDPNHFELGDYTLDYKGACIMYDEVGRDSLVMTFDFTNNSKENASCGWVITTSYMQNGVEMESAYVLADANTYDSVAEKYYTDIAPGVTLEVKNAHLLSDMSEVTVTFSELWSRKSYEITVDPSTLERVENEYTDDSDWWDEQLSDYDSEEEPEEPVEEEPVASFTDWWEGDWYGWWIIEEATGDYEGYAGYWWDAFARISVNDDLTGTFEMWDDEGSCDDLVSLLDVSFTEQGYTEHGSMVSEGGQFMGAVHDPGEWVIDPDDAPVGEMIAFEGTNVGDNGEYSFSVYLRPWGTIWDDVEDAELPYYYDDWYLPFVEAGAAMPDSINEPVPEGGSADTAEPEGSSAALSGNMVPFTIDGKTTDDVPFTFSFSLPEGLWDMETYKFPHNFSIYNCPDGDDVPWDTPFIWVQFYDNETKLNFDVPNYENLSETEGRTIGGVEMQGRKYDRFGYEQMQEYYGVLPSGLGVSIRLVKAPDSLLPECQAILDTFTFD